MILRYISTLKFLLLIITFECSSQNYIDYLNAANEAEHEFVSGDLDSANKIFTSLEKKYHSLKAKDYFYNGLIFYFKNDTLKGKEYLIKSAELRLRVSGELKQFKSKFPELKISESTIQQLTLIEKKELSPKEKEIGDTIKELIKLDQEDRVLDKYDEKKDILVQMRLLHFLQKNGTPNPYTQGEGIFIIIIHISDTTLYRLYKSFLYKEIVKGNVTPFYYCGLVDRTLYSTGHNILYKAYPVPLKEMDGISKEQFIENRKKVGLSPYYQGTGMFPIIRMK